MLLIFSVVGGKLIWFVVLATCWTWLGCTESPVVVVLVSPLLLLPVTRVVMIGCGGLALDMILDPFSAFIGEKMLAAAVTAAAAFVVAILFELLEERMFLTRLLIVLEVELAELELPLVELALGVEWRVILLVGDGPTLILRLFTFTVVGMFIASILY